MFLSAQRKIWHWLKKRLKVRSFDHLKTNIRRKIERRFYKRKYDTKELIARMKDLGLKKGATVCIHSSWDEFYNYQGSIVDFINAILKEIGAEGTLLMPAFPLLPKPDSVFKIKTTPTAAGMVAETFRRYPNVKRSVDRHSVCAVGARADYLLSEHQYAATCWDKKSPYYKLGEVDALIFSFGLGKYFSGTSAHCVDSILKDEILFFQLLFQKKMGDMKFLLEDGSTYTKEIFSHDDSIKSIHYPNGGIKGVLKHFDKSKYKQTKISNLRINMFEANYLIRRMIELGRRGITAYGRPTPSKKLFNVINKC